MIGKNEEKYSVEENFNFLGRKMIYIIFEIKE